MSSNNRLFLFVALIFVAFFLQQHPQFLEEKNQNFFLAIVVAFIGSAAGAWGGAYAVEQKQKLKQLTEEARAIEVATVIAMNTMDSLSMIYDQEIRPLFESYQKLQQQFKDKQKNLDFSEQYAVFPPLEIDVSKLSDLLYNKISMTARGLTAHHKFIKYLKLLEECKMHRRKLLDEVYADNKPKPSDSELLDIFVHNDVYGGVVKSLYTYSRHCLFYSNVIHEELRTLHKSLQTQCSAKDETSQFIMSDELKAMVPSSDEYTHFTNVYPRCISQDCE